MTQKLIVPATFKEAAEAARMSPGVLSGGHVFLTGVTGSDPRGGMPEDPVDQFQSVFDKVAGVLSEAGADLGAVVEMTSYHVGLREHFDAFDAVRTERLCAPYPAWTAVEVAGLRRPGALVEVRVIAKAP